MEYKEEDFLMISGLQHFSFCRRQWALIHIEQQWAENFRTTDGAILHKNAHDKGLRESRGGCVITRGMNIFSRTMGVSGECDVVEFHRGSSGIPLKGREGLWQPYPVEYKRGKPFDAGGNGDALQLCCQALCLEEMLCCTVSEGALYFGETRRRQSVTFSAQLRAAVHEALAEMHALNQRGHTPSARPSKACNACSLQELCLPKLTGKRSVQAYLRSHMEDNA